MKFVAFFPEWRNMPSTAVTPPHHLTKNALSEGKARAWLGPGTGVYRRFLSHSFLSSLLCAVIFHFSVTKTHCVEGWSFDLLFFSCPVIFQTTVVIGENFKYGNFIWSFVFSSNRLSSRSVIFSYTFPTEVKKKKKKLTTGDLSQQMFTHKPDAWQLVQRRAAGQG